jgi:hypothetical protein
VTRKTSISASLSQEDQSTTTSNWPNAAGRGLAGRFKRASIGSNQEQNDVLADGKVAARIYEDAASALPAPR